MQPEKVPWSSHGMPRPDPASIADIIHSAASDGWYVALTVGIPMCSDGDQVWFGSGIYDPLQEKLLIEPPGGISDATRDDLIFATSIADSVRRNSTGKTALPTFSLSVFDAKIVHHIGRPAARAVQARVAAEPEDFLPEEAVELRRRLNGDLALNFSLDYRARGDRFVDRLRRSVRPVVPTVPTSRLISLFRDTGTVLLKRLPIEGDAPGMGHLFCATPNTLPHRDQQKSIHPLDARRKIQARLASIPLTNRHGSYICEVTALGRLLQMVDDARPGEDYAGLLTISVVNVNDAGNHKIHRMSWAAGEIISSCSGRIVPDGLLTGVPQVHMTVVSDGKERIVIDSVPDSKRRELFLDRLHDRLRRAGTAHRKEEIIAAALESIRLKVESGSHEGGRLVLLSGPGDSSC